MGGSARFIRTISSGRPGLAGTLTMYLGTPPERHDAAAGGLIHARAGTPLQTANHGAVDLLVYAYGSPPDEGADVLASAV